MNLLLDTHTLLWWLEDAPQLSPSARRCLSLKENAVSFSLVSIWEMAIKISLGKLSLSCGLDKVTDELRRLSIRALPIEVQHCSEVARLPFHHRDPFDRLLVAQARCEKMDIVSGDSQLELYEVKRVW